MTVQNDSNVKTYTGNGVTTVFPYDFFIPGDSATDQSNVEVTLLEIATQVEGDPLSTGLWSITGVNTEAFGNVTYTGGGTPLPATHKLNIRRVVPYEQNLDLTTQSAYFPELLEQQLDLIVYQVQQLAEESARSVKVGVGSTTDPADLINDLLDAEGAAAASASAAAASAVSAASAATTAAADAVAAVEADLAADLAAAVAAKVAAEAAETAAEVAQAAAEAAAAGIGTLGSLSDVDTTGATLGDGLTFDGTDWVPGAPAGGGGLFKGNNGEVGSSAGDIFRINAQTLTEDVTIDADENASATGPLTIESGNTLTVASGGTLAIV
jgi:hypothetical protein